VLGKAKNISGSRSLDYSWGWRRGGRSRKVGGKQLER
jgi:hypothetical protein